MKPDTAFPITISVPPDAAGQRLDQFLAAQIPDVSRVRVRLLLEEEMALVNGAAAKPSLKLKGGEAITVLGDPAPPPIKAIAEAIPLDVLYEDADLAIINKPAGMMVHAGAGATEDERNRGTLVNALLHRFTQLSEVSGELRPGIVHRLDKETSGLIIVAKNDVAHRKLGEQFAGRKVQKRYVALVHGWPERQRGTISAEISRDSIRRIRMTTRGSGGRTAVSHYEVRERIESRFGKFALVEVRIETGRTHQIRVHMSSIGHPVVGDSLYGAAGVLRAQAGAKASSKKTKQSDGATEVAPLQDAESSQAKPQVLRLDRNFLHAAAVELTHPRTGDSLAFEAPLPPELTRFLEQLRS